MWLTVRSGNDLGRTICVAGDRIVLGRDEACDFVIDDAKVSRQHLALEPLADGRVALLDLGSSNGTFVNGNRVESAVLEGSDQLQLGGTVLVSSRDEPVAEAGGTEIGSLASALQTVRRSSAGRPTLVATGDRPCDRGGRDGHGRRAALRDRHAAFRRG